MKIVIDTNILIASNLTSNALKNLINFARNTGSQIVIPVVVYEETIGVFERQLRERLGKLENAHREITRSIPGYALSPIDISAEVSNFRQRMLDTLGISEDDIMPYKLEYIADVVHRAIYRKRPCSDKGEEIRDAIVWLMVKDAARSSDSEETIFIASNPKEFAASKENPSELHPDLLDEVRSEALDIKFFNLIDSFLKDVAPNLPYLTEEWLNNHAAISEVENDSLLFLESPEGKADLEQWAKAQGVLLNDRNYPDDNIAYPKQVKLSLSEFYPYLRENGEYMIVATYRGVAEVGFDVITEVSMSGNDLDAWHSRTQETEIQTQHPKIEARVEVIVVGEKEGIRHVVTTDVVVQDSKPS